MVFPVLPVYSDDALDILKSKPYLKITGQALIDSSKVSGIKLLELVQKLRSEFCLLAVLIPENHVPKEDPAFWTKLLNEGVSTLFVENPVVGQELAEATEIPLERLAMLSKGTYSNTFRVVHRFPKSSLVLADEITVPFLTDAILSELKTDRTDALYTTLVVDQSERCLGLVYSSKESIRMALEKMAGVYYSRSRQELWVKGATSGNTQRLVSIHLDCDGDALKFIVEQGGKCRDFCHLNTTSCFGEFKQDLHGLEEVLKQRLIDAPVGSYTKRLFDNPDLLAAKIKEEADELVDAKSPEEIAWEAADLFYFAVTKLVANGVSLRDVENNLNLKSLKVTRRQGDAKPKYINGNKKAKLNVQQQQEVVQDQGLIHLNVVNSKNNDAMEKALARPIQKTTEIMHLVNPIIEKIKEEGDKAVIEYTAKFDGVHLTQTVLEAPFPEEYFEGLTEEMKEALDLSIENVRKFHAAQLQTNVLEVETQPGVLCTRFPRPIEKVGLYIPGGTAILPSTALMLGVPAQVAQCKEIVFASPPRKSDGRVSPEVIYVAAKVGVSKILLAGGAQAVAAMAYGTESVPKVDKILGPGNQFVTAAKMYVQNDTQALCSIDMPAGPSEVLVVADEEADVDFIASDLLSQAEHGIDSQVILVGVNLSNEKVEAIQNAVHMQAIELPRVDIVRKCIAHSSIILCDSYEAAFDMSNRYAPEHLILQIANAEDYVKLVDHAGSIFVGSYTPESCGDYSSGTNHTLPTYGYARQYSGANTSTFQKFITSQTITPEGLKNIGKAVMCVAKKEGLDGHRNAVKIRMNKLGLLPDNFE